MKLEVFLLGEGTSRDLVFEDADYHPMTRGGVSSLMKEAANHVLETVVLKYFKDGFGLSTSRISASAGVVRQRLICGGRNVVLKPVDGRMVPVEDRSSPDREFEIVLRLDADSLRLKPISGVRLERLEIQNVRSLRQLTVDFHDSSNLLLLAGLNGSGKTSVLEAILHAFLKNERREDVRSLPDQDYRIIVNFRAISGLGYRIERTPKYHRLIDAEGTVLADTEYEFRRIFSEMGILFASSLRQTTASRRGRMTIRRLSRSADESPIETLRASCVIEFINKKLNPQTATLEYLLRLNKCWKRFYPEQSGGFVIAEDMSLRGPTSSGELTHDLFLQREKDGERIGLSDLSSGEQEILSLVAQVMVAKSKFDLVLIDEPELHLNRVWHATIIDVLSHLDDGCQFIMATHSPDIWDAVYSWDRIFLKGEEVVRG